MTPGCLLGATGVALAVLAAAPACQAAPVNDDGAISGDLPPDAGPALFALNVGVNTVRGHFGVSASGFDFDSFAFSIPAGQVLTRFSLRVMDVEVPLTGAGYSLQTVAEGRTVVLRAFAVGAPSTTDFTANQGAGIYGLQQSFLGIRPGAGFASANCVFSFTVAADATVPEPTSWALAASAIGALVPARGGAQRRLKSLHRQAIKKA